MVTKEEFMKVWKDSSKESILNQFYYEHIELRKQYGKMSRAINYIDQVISYKPCAKEIDEELNTLIGILMEGINETNKLINGDKKSNGNN